MCPKVFATSARVIGDLRLVALLSRFCPNCHASLKFPFSTICWKHAKFSGSSSVVNFAASSTSWFEVIVFLESSEPSVSAGPLLICARRTMARARSLRRFSCRIISKRAFFSARTCPWALAATAILRRIRIPLARNAAARCQADFAMMKGAVPSVLSVVFWAAQQSPSSSERMVPAMLDDSKDGHSKCSDLIILDNTSSAAAVSPRSSKTRLFKDSFRIWMPESFSDLPGSSLISIGISLSLLSNMRASSVIIAE